MFGALVRLSVAVGAGAQLRDPSPARAQPGESEITWAERGGPASSNAVAGSAVPWLVQWGVSNTSAAAAAASILSGAFWYGGSVATDDARCHVNASYLLTCELGALQPGQWAAPVAFEVAVPAEAVPGPLPYFLGGQGGFANGPETLGRIEVVQSLSQNPHSNAWEQVDLRTHTDTHAETHRDTRRHTDAGTHTRDWKQRQRSQEPELGQSPRRERHTDTHREARRERQTHTNARARCRDPVQAPFSSKSIWNAPIGSAAIFVPAHIYDASRGFAPPVNFHNDQEFVIETSAADPFVRWYNQPSGDNAAPGASACTILNTSVSTTSVRMPHSFTTTAEPNNNPAVLIQPDRRTYIEMQPLYRCYPGGPIAAAYGGETQPTPHLSDLYGEGTLGAHGGSGLSALGGQIRLHELDPASGPILHALKLELLGNLYYSPKRRHMTAAGIDGSFRWPAVGSDGYTYNSPQYPGLLYNGSVPELVPGALLAIPAQLSNQLRTALTTEFGRRVLDALTHYGGYVVDDTANPLAAICMEAGSGDRLAAMYGADFNMSYHGTRYPQGTGVYRGPLYKDLVLAFQALHVVDNNAPDSVGGGGAPLVPPPPPLCAPPQS